MMFPTRTEAYDVVERFIDGRSGDHLLRFLLDHPYR
jgi:hypothetical protein